MNLIPAGIQPHVIVFPALFLLGLLIVVVSWWLAAKMDRRNGRDSEGAFALEVFGSTLGGLLVVIFLILSITYLIPFQAQYFQYYKVSGTITTVSSAYLQSGSGDEGGTNTKYSLRLNDSRVVLTSTDARIGSFKVGEKINLTCTYSWVYQGQKTIDCVVRSY